MTQKKTNEEKPLEPGVIVEQMQKDKFSKLTLVKVSGLNLMPIMRPWLLERGKEFMHINSNILKPNYKIKLAHQKHKKEIGLVLMSELLFDTDRIYRAILRSGYKILPAPYLIGLGYDYPKLITRFSRITTLDDENIILNEVGEPCYFDVHQCDNGNGQPDLSLVCVNEHWCRKQWYAIDLP